MASTNYIRLRGRVSRNSEMRYTPDGKECVTFQIEIEEPKAEMYGNFSSTRKWSYTAVLIGIEIEFAENELVDIIGKIYTRSWKKGNDWMQRTEILVETYEIIYE